MDDREILEKENMQTILNFMADDKYVPMKPKDMAFILGVPKDKYEEFHRIIKKLEEKCKIEITKKGKCILLSEEIYKTGVLRLNRKKFGFVKIEDSEEEVFIQQSNLNGALNEDTVAVKVLSQSSVEGQNAEGKVVKIIKRGKNMVVGTFQPSRNFGFVVPDDQNFGTDIFISKKDFGGAKKNDKVVVKITKFAQLRKKAEGKIVEIIGNSNEAGVDIMSIVKEYKLPYDFPEPVLKEAKEVESEITAEELRGREDFRGKEIFTIDGEDAKDLDDAVCVEKNADGNYVLSVHIADVSHYVTEKSELNKEAIVRGTSVYMMDRVIPMLPKELSNGICSLNEGVDRLTLSVLMEITPDGKVVSSDIKKGVIRVTKRMSYNKVYKILKYIEEKDGCEYKAVEEPEEKEKIGSEITELFEEVKEYERYFEHFKLMAELARILKQKRVISGSLDLDIPESKIILNSDGVAVDVMKYEITFANEIIEQFMLIANETVAEKFFWLEAPFIYRVHPVPDMDKIRELNGMLSGIGYRIKANKDNIHPKAFAEVLAQVKGQKEEMVVSNLILRTLKIAQYESENRGHFGIASKYYCHFTSPIRRYPDLFIHRIISMYIDCNYNFSEDKVEKYSEQAEKYAKSSSEREKVAQKAERDSVDMKKAEYMSSKIGEVYSGIISNVTSFGVFVELENTVEGLIRFENLGDDYYFYDDMNKKLIGERTGKVFKIGDNIDIRVIEANKELRRISFEAIL